MNRMKPGYSPLPGVHLVGENNLNFMKKMKNIVNRGCLDVLRSRCKPGSIGRMNDKYQGDCLAFQYGKYAENPDRRLDQTDLIFERLIFTVNNYTS